MSRLNVMQLLSSLQNLYYRMAHLRLNARIDSYQDSKGEGVAEDISTPLSEHIEALARKASEDKAQPLSRAVSSPHGPGKTETQGATRANRRPVKAQIVHKGLNGLSRLFKRRSAMVMVQPHLSDQLQRRVRQHLNTALRQARQGDSKNAKLHADLACNGMHELMRYMPQENFTRFNQQISANLKDFQDQEVFRPLTKFLDYGASAPVQ